MQGNVAIFEKFLSVVEKTEELAKKLKTSILDQLQSLEIEFQLYFCELNEEQNAFYEIRSLPLWL